MITYSEHPHRRFNPGTARCVICRANLHSLSVAISVYNGDLQGYPAATQWSDVIKPYGDPKELICPADKTGPCSYAMNENIPADANDLPDDLVVLFESAPGWNEVGGADDVVTDRHGKPGANIAFADGHVEFVKAEDIPNLRWTVDEQQKRGAGATR